MSISLFFFGILGLFSGSFLNMLIDRLPRGEQIWTGRSHCDNCGKSLKWYDLFPVASWFILGGKCRFCRSPIPFRNTLVEIITGVVFYVTVVTELRVPAVAEAMAGKAGYGLPSYLYLFLLLVVFSCLITIFFIDLRERIIPDELVVVGILGSVGVIIGQIGLMGRISPIGLIENYLFSGVGAGLFFLFLVLITKGKGMGLGDVKLAFLMGLFLGFPRIIVSLYIAFLTGALGGVILILGGKKRFGEQIAFGPFLVIGTIIAFFYSQILIKLFLPILGGL